MSSIPPTGLSSLIQSHGAERRASEARSRENADEAKAAQRGEFARKLADAIGSEDRDSEVYSDAEGPGGHARSRSDAEDGASEEAPADEHASTEPPPPGTLDIEA